MDIRVIGLGLAGRREEARAALIEMRRASSIPLFLAWIELLMAWLDRRPADMVLDPAKIGPLRVFDDPEAMFQQGWLFCDAGAHERGLEYLQRAVAHGYFVAPTLSGSRHFDALRTSLAFQALLEEAETGRRAALTAFREAGGHRLLGLPTGAA